MSEPLNVSGPEGLPAVRQPASEPASELLRRFLEWDALNPLPDPIPAPFADLPYWIAEMRAALGAARGDTPAPEFCGDCADPSTCGRTGVCSKA